MISIVKPLVAAYMTAAFIVARKAYAVPPVSSGQERSVAKGRGYVLLGRYSIAFTKYACPLSVK